MQEALHGKRVVAVNAASAYHAGGGFQTGGRHALEEAMCAGLGILVWGFGTWVRRNTGVSMQLTWGDLQRTPRVISEDPRTSCALKVFAF